MTRDPWNSEQDRTDAQVWLWRGLAEIRVARRFDRDRQLPSSALDALEHEVQGLLDDLHDDGKWNEYDTDTARLVWHATVVKAARTIEAMGGQFGGAFDRIQAITYANVWRAWNTGPIVSLAATS